MEYSVIKLLHIGSLVFWLGVPLGAWLVLKSAKRNHPENITLLQQVSQVFFITLIIEHIAFALLLISGSWMAISYGWWNTAWLNQKLWLVGAILLPLEIVDIVLGNFIAAKASARFYQQKSLSPWQKRALSIYHGSFTKIAIIIIPIAVILIMYLAISKTPLI